MERPRSPTKLTQPKIRLSTTENSAQLSGSPTIDNLTVENPTVKKMDSQYTTAEKSALVQNNSEKPLPRFKAQVTN